MHQSQPTLLLLLAKKSKTCSPGNFYGQKSIMLVSHLRLQRGNWHSTLHNLPSKMTKKEQGRDIIAWESAWCSSNGYLYINLFWVWLLWARQRTFTYPRSLVKLKFSSHLTAPSHLFMKKKSVPCFPLDHNLGQGQFPSADWAEFCSLFHQNECVECLENLRTVKMAVVLLTKFHIRLNLKQALKPTALLTLAFHCAVFFNSCSTSLFSSPTVWYRQM